MSRSWLSVPNVGISCGRARRPGGPARRVLCRRRDGSGRQLNAELDGLPLRVLDRSCNHFNKRVADGDVSIKIQGPLCALPVNNVQPVLTEGIVIHAYTQSLHGKLNATLAFAEALDLWLCRAFLEFVTKASAQLLGSISQLFFMVEEYDIDGCKTSNAFPSK
jgi:hypothetical protein